MYQNTQLFIQGQWQDAQDQHTLAVINPATEETIGYVAKATQADLDLALQASEVGIKE